jgi:hypothetical protein
MQGSYTSIIVSAQAIAEQSIHSVFLASCILSRAGVRLRAVGLELFKRHLWNQARPVVYLTPNGKILTRSDLVQRLTCLHCRQVRDLPATIFLLFNLLTVFSIFLDQFNSIDSEDMHYSTYMYLYNLVYNHQPRPTQ